MCSGRLLLRLRLIGGLEQEFSVEVFIRLVKLRTTESISAVVFNGIFKEMLFSTVFENLDQWMIHGVMVENYLVTAIWLFRVSSIGE